MSRISFLLVIFFTTYGNPYELSFNSGVRTYPFSASVDAQYKLESVLWDRRSVTDGNGNEKQTKWKFGMAQIKALVASHGQVEGTVSVYPVGFMEIGASLSTTSRFYATKPFNCDFIVCKGILKRSNTFARLLMGYEIAQGSLFAILAGHQSLNTVEDTSKDFADETEKLLGRAGEDEFKSKSILAGIKHQLGTVALFYRFAEYQKSKQKNEYSYLIYRNEFDQYRLSLGMGQYQSSQFQGEFSAIMGLTYTFGKTVALF